MAKSCRRYATCLCCPSRALSTHCTACPHPPVRRSRFNVKLHVMLQEKVLATLAEWQADPVTASNVTVLLVAGLIHTNLENYVEALRAVHGGHNLEMCATLVPNVKPCSLPNLCICLLSPPRRTSRQICCAEVRAPPTACHQLCTSPHMMCWSTQSGYVLCRMAVSVMNFLSINRVDQAEKQLKAMAALDEDATVTQLAMAWVNIFLVRSQLLTPCIARQHVRACWLQYRAPPCASQADLWAVDCRAARRCRTRPTFSRSWATNTTGRWVAAPHADDTAFFTYLPHHSQRLNHEPIHLQCCALPTDMLRAPSCRRPTLPRAQVRLLNGSAVCNMRMGRWEEAESQLMEAFEKDAKNPDTLANLATASLHLGKPASRFVGCVPALWHLVHHAAQVNVVRLADSRRCMYAGNSKPLRPSTRLW